jgi:hypothetical protein
MIERGEPAPAGAIELRATGKLSKRVFAWMAPGAVRTFDVDELEAARAWVVG